MRAKGGPPHKGDTPSVEVRAPLPAQARRPLPSASYAPSHKQEYLEGDERGYIEEEMKVEVNPPGFEPPRGSVTLYA